MDQQNNKREIRDLLSLLALPSLWAGKDPRFICRTAVEAVERLVGFEAAFVRVPWLDGTWIELFHLNGAWRDEPGTAWREFFTRANRPLDPKAGAEDSPTGPLHIARFTPGYGEGTGTFLFGGHEAFTNSQLTVLRATLSLAATSLAGAASEQKLRLADRAKDEFLAMLGHELRNPLAPIVASIELLRLRHGETLPLEYRIIERQVGKLTRLVDDLLDVSRVVTGKVRVQLESMDLAALVRDVLADFIAPLKAKNIGLEVRAPESLVVLGDRTRLDQVVRNLMVNASKFTNEGGAIRVELSSDGERASLAITDDGCGIAAELLPHIFDLFTQGQTTVARSNGGMGVGLALVKRLMQMHGGTVHASSPGVGMGARFEIGVPLYTRPQKVEQQVSVSTAQPELSGTRVLVVDDNADALSSLVDLLRAAGCNVEIATNGVEALQKAVSFTPSHVILDIGLPGKDGYEVARELRLGAANRDLVLIALSGYGQEDDKQKSRAAGFDTHFTKPVAVAQLFSFLGSAP